MHPLDLNHQDRNSATKPRALGFVTAGADGSQGTLLDIEINATALAGAQYQLALYMVGAVKPPSKATWSATKQAIRVMDLDTFNVIAPTPMLDDDGTGLYWVLRYSGGVRLRVMPLHSDAGFSAVFFDQV
jgi:hypothetical protein